jgi:hypothetical protein
MEAAPNAMPLNAYGRAGTMMFFTRKDYDMDALTANSHLAQQPSRWQGAVLLRRINPRQPGTIGFNK